MPQSAMPLGAQADASKQLVPLEAFACVRHADVPSMMCDTQEERTSHEVQA